MKNIISIECGSWYCREDGMVQILNRSGKKIILNIVYSKVWEKINYGIYKEDLIEIMKNELSEETVEHILEELHSKRLINISTENNNFEKLFK